MVFSSVVFLFAFLPTVLIGYYLLDNKFKNIFLLITSLLFYAWGEPRFVFIMLLSIAMNYVYALLVDKCHKKTVKSFVLCLAIVSNVGIFIIFKYLGFLFSNVNLLFNVDLKVPEIALPIGISFFTFQAISYVVDVYRGDGKVQKNPLNVGLYISFFPQLIAGPIVRYDTIAEQISYRNETWDDICEGIMRFVVGLGKKIILSNQFALLVDRCFDNIAKDNMSVLLVWIGSIAYTLQIYFDFSGYSDMAIGLGRMFGFRFSENFNYPYISKSITEFWRRWHISLSTWFRDYVYIPLGGSKCRKSRNVFNLFIVWTLTGIWHGANWNFIFWGWIYFVVLVFEKLTKISDKLKGIGIEIYRLATLLIVNLCWVLFRAPNLSTAMLYFKRMFGLTNNSIYDAKSLLILDDYKWLFIIGIIGATPILTKVSEKLTSKWQCICISIIKYTFLGLVFVVCVSSVVSSSYNPFIYFNF